LIGDTPRATELFKFPYGPNEKRVGEKIEYYDWKMGKALDKEFFAKKIGAKSGAEIPMFCFVGRISGGQKGLDILHRLLRRIDQTKLQLFFWNREKEWKKISMADYFFNPKISLAF